MFSSICMLQGIPKDTWLANEKQERWLSSGAIKFLLKNILCITRGLKNSMIFVFRWSITQLTNKLKSTHLQWLVCNVMKLTWTCSPVAKHSYSMCVFIRKCLPCDCCHPSRQVTCILRCNLNLDIEKVIRMLCHTFERIS